MNPEVNAFWAGLFYLLAGVCGLVRTFLLEPHVPSYPKAPQWLLHVCFLVSVVLMFSGMRFLWAYASGAAVTVPPGATGNGVLMAFALFAYNAAMMINVARQRYPVETWARLNHISDLALCSKRGDR